MRLAFGLLGILGTLIAIALFWGFAYLPYTQQVVSSGQSAQTRVEQMAGLDTQLGGRVSEHIVFEPVERGGRLAGLAVKSIGPGSSYQAYYGIQPGDVIDQVGPQMVRDLDVEMAKALALESYQRKWELGVYRVGKRYMLPTDMARLPGAAPAAQPGQIAQPAQSAVAPQPNQPAPVSVPGQQASERGKQANPNETPLQRQMDAILNFQSENAGK